MASSSEHAPLLPGSLRARLESWLLGLLGYALLALAIAVAASLLTAKARARSSVPPCPVATTLIDVLGGVARTLCFEQITAPLTPGLRTTSCP